MKIPFFSPVTNLDGVQFKYDGKVRTLAEFCLPVLQEITSIEGTVSGEEKYLRFELMCKIKAAETGLVDVTVEEIAKLKKLIGIFYNTVPLVGAIYDIFEGKTREVATPAAAAPEAAATEATSPPTSGTAA
jgi:hypothetical protein